MSMTSGATADHLYVVGENEGSPIVKVGRSGRPKSRLTSIQTGYPRKLRLLHVEESAGNLEDEVHKALAARRISGEWFDFGGEAALATVRQVIADLKTIQEIAARNAVTVSLTSTYQAPPMAVVESETPLEAGSRPDRRPPSRPQVRVERDPCEGPALMQVGNAAVRAFFSTHPDPTAYLRSLAIPAHHIEWYYQELPLYNMDVDADLRADAKRERAAPESLSLQRDADIFCELPGAYLRAS